MSVIAAGSVNYFTLDGAASAHPDGVAIYLPGRARGAAPAPGDARGSERMDPNLFYVDGERLVEVLLLIVILSFFVERALAIVFESRALVDKLSESGLKEFIAFTVALGVCRFWDFDALSVLMPRETTHFLGHAVTAAVIAGGSKASIRLFHDLMHVMSTAEKERKARQAAASGGGA